MEQRESRMELSLATWLFDIFLWSAVIVLGTVVFLDMLNVRDDDE